MFTNPGPKSADADLGSASWVDLHQAPVSSLLVPPYGSAVLVRDVLFEDGFETGDTSKWTVTIGAK